MRSEYYRDPQRVDRALREKGIIAIVTDKHVIAPHDLVELFLEVHRFGYLPEMTYRIDTSILKTAFQELGRRRFEFGHDDPLILAIGSIKTAMELETALD